MKKHFLIAQIFSMALTSQLFSQTCPEQLKDMGMSDREAIRTITLEKDQFFLLNELETFGFKRLLQEARLSPDAIESLEISTFSYPEVNEVQGFRVDVTLNEDIRSQFAASYYLKRQSGNFYAILRTSEILMPSRLWLCELPVDGEMPEQQIIAFINDLIDDGGEYLDFSKEYQKNIKSTLFGDLPADIQKIGKKVAQELSDSTTGISGEPMQAGFSDEQFIIYDDFGRIIGYIIRIDYYIDDSLFDGGGVSIFVTRSGNIVDEVEWFG